MELQELQMFQDIAKMIRLARKCVISSEITIIKKLGENFSGSFSFAHFYLIK